jgi:hypothetical protein
MSRSLGLSCSTIRKYVKMFLDSGWCRMHKGNLMFCKHSQLPLKRDKKRFIHTIKYVITDWSARGFETALLAFQIDNRQRQQGYAEAKGDRRSRDAASIENLQHRTFTVEQGRKLFKRSKQTASRIFRRIADAGYFTRTVKQPHTTYRFVWDGPNFVKEVVPPIADITAMLEGTQVFYKSLTLTVYPGIIHWHTEVLARIYSRYRDQLQHPYSDGRSTPDN